MSEETNQETSIIEQRQEKSKELLIEQLKKIPIVQLACEKVGVARSTVYRWRKSDQKFAEAVDKALSEGNKLVNDLAESQLLAAIKEGNLTSIIFWLKHHHKSYANKIEISGRIKTGDDKLTKEQEETIKEALKLSALIPENNKLINNKQGKK